MTILIDSYDSFSYILYQLVGELDPKATTVQELGLYMAGAKRTKKEGEPA